MAQLPWPTPNVYWSLFIPQTNGGTSTNSHFKVRDLKTSLQPEATNSSSSMSSVLLSLPGSVSYPVVSLDVSLTL